MAILYYPLREVEGCVPANLYADTQLFMVGDTDAEKPTSGLKLGWRYFAKDNGKIYKATSTTAWAEIGGGAPGSFAIYQAEIDFGSTPVEEASFAVTDAAITASMKVIGGMAYVAPAGRDLDEVEMEPFNCRFVAGTGNFTILVQAIEGPVEGKYKLDYTYA